MRPLVLAAVLGLVTVTLVPTPVQAAGGSDDLTTGSTNDWDVLVYDQALRCAHVELWYNFSSSWQVQNIAIWMMNPEAGYVRSALIIGEPWENRVHVQVLGADVVDLNVQTVGLVTQAYFDLGSHCDRDFRRFALVAPDAADAHLRVSYPSQPGGATPAVTHHYGGDGAFAAHADDFRGTKAEVGVTDNGASATTLASWSTTTDPGLMAVFASTDQVALLSVQHPDGAQSGGMCTGVGLFGYASCSAPLGNIGLGEAPGGTWTFRVDAEAGAELLHVYAVGAPLNWGGT